MAECLLGAERPSFRGHTEGKTPELLIAFARGSAAFACTFLTWEDVGTTFADIEVMRPA